MSWVSVDENICPFVTYKLHLENYSICALASHSWSQCDCNWVMACISLFPGHGCLAFTQAWAIHLFAHCARSSWFKPTQICPEHPPVSFTLQTNFSEKWGPHQSKCQDHMHVHIQLWYSHCFMHYHFYGYFYDSMVTVLIGCLVQKVVLTETFLIQPQAKIMETPHKEDLHQAFLQTNHRWNIFVEQLNNLTSWK